MERAKVIEERRLEQNARRRDRYNEERELLREYAPRRTRANARLRPQADTLLRFSKDNDERGAGGTLRGTLLPVATELQTGGAQGGGDALNQGGKGIRQHLLAAASHSEETEI
jgi:hypothetical protein